MTSTTPAVEDDRVRPTTIVIADDHALVRHGIRLIISQVDGLRVVGEASDGDELLSLVASLAPDLVLSDIAMPRVDGFTAIAAIKARHPQTHVLAMSMHDAPEIIRKAIRAGANGYIVKNAPATELTHAIQCVAHGIRYFSSEVAFRLAESEEADPGDVLTERQLEILIRLVSGQSSKQIGFELGLSPRTVDVHRAAVMARLGVGDLATLTLYAVRWRLVDPQKFSRN